MPSINPPYKFLLAYGKFFDGYVYPTLVAKNML